jgi:UDP:flavonoid glycosyltransferase YjiC (YdhE family)
MIEKKRILFFPFELLAHYLRCLVLADRYDKELYEIYFLESAAYGSFVQEHGYKTFSATSFDSTEVMQCAAKFDFSWLEYHSIEAVFLSSVAAIKELKADLVIGDVAPALKMAAAYTGVEYLALMNGYMSPFYANQRKLSRTHPAFSLLQRIPPFIAQHCTAYGEKLSFWKIHAPFKRLRRKYKLPAVYSYLWEMQADHNLICDLPEVFPQRNLPDNYQIIGPLIYEGPGTAGETENLFHLFDDSKPTICVCMGSSGDWEQLAFLNDHSFAAYNIIAAGDSKRVLQASHIKSPRFINLRQVLKRSDLLICHGGNGTVNTAILENVYMLCVTSNFEQEWNVEAIEKLGLGKLANDFSADDWQREIQQSLNRRMKITG